MTTTVRRSVASSLLAALLAVAGLLAVTTDAHAATASGKTAVKTQLMPQPKISGSTPILWIPANTTLTLQCLAVGEKAYGAVAQADPYYYRVTYAGKTGYAIDADLYTSADATKLGLTYCSIPAEPGKPTISSLASSSLTLGWADNSNNETSFKTQYSTDGGKTWKAGPSASANARSISVTGLSPSTAYTFQVGASNNKGTKWSAYATATTPAGPKNIGSGLCDYVKSGQNYVKSVGKGKVLGTYELAGWRMSVCGPRPQADGGSVGSAGLGVNPFGGSPTVNDLDGYQCTELAARWLYYAYGAKGADANGIYNGGNGKEVVTKYAARFPDKFVKYSDAKANRPVPGDVISFDTGDAWGHVGVVHAVSIDGSGNGSIAVLEQNSARTGGDKGRSSYKVTGWKIEQAINWLHRK